MEALSKARTAFHSAAAKAERVFTDIKSDFILSDHREDSDNKLSRDFKTQLEDNKPSPNCETESKVHNEAKHLRWKSASVVTKQDWQDRFRNIRLGRKGIEDSEKVENSTMAVPFYDDNLYILNVKTDQEAKGSEVVPLLEDSYAETNKIPPASVMRQLAVAVEAGKKARSMKDLMTSSGDSSPARERGGLSLSAVKSLVLRDREDKLAAEFCSDEKILALIERIFDPEGIFLKRKIETGSEILTQFPKDIHGAPLDCILVQLSEVIGSFKTIRKMALFWWKIVTEVRRLWSEGIYLPGIPKDDIPDLKSCLLYQQLQVINCCVSRKKRRAVATESVDSVMGGAGSNIDESSVSEGTIPAGPLLYAKLNNGELVLRLGADRPTSDLRMLETGEPVYSPILQEGPLLTEDLIKETEELVLRTGSMGAGCSQLLSDMQAFKAANPGCILEDFVRWHSPPDWTESECSDAKESVAEGESTSTRGQLSTRMQKEGNLWRELWETAKPVPAVKQSPLFDEDLAVEGILDVFEGIPPSELFEQLFISLLGLGFVLAGATLSTNEELSKLFYDCKDYVVATCQGDQLSEKLDELCQVYETVESLLRHPEEVLKAIKQTDDPVNNSVVPKRRFMGLRINFGGKDKQQKRSPTASDKKESETTPTRQPFASFFDGKSSLFSKKPPKPENASPVEKYPGPGLVDDGEWTIVQP